MGSVTQQRAVAIVARLAESGGTLPCALVAPGLTDDQAQRAVALAAGAGLVRREPGAVVLTEVGRRAAEHVRRGGGW